MKKIARIISLMFCLCFAMSSFAVFAADLDIRDKFNDSKWGLWTRIFPEGNFTEPERAPILPKVVDGKLSLSINSIYATGFIQDSKISPHNAKVTASITELPTTGKGDVMYDGVNNFGCFFMIGLSDDQLKSNSREWIFKSTGVYLMVSPKTATESSFSMVYNYPDSKLDEIQREEKATDNLLQFNGITLPLALKDTYDVEFTKDDVLITIKGTKYSLKEKANGDLNIFDPYYHQKAYKALKGSASECFAVFNSAPQNKPSTLVISSFTGNAPKSEDGIAYDAKQAVKSSAAASSKSLTEVETVDDANYLPFIIAGAAVLVVIIAVVIVVLTKKKKNS